MDILDSLSSLIQDNKNQQNVINCVEKIEQFNQKYESVFHYSDILTNSDHNRLLDYTFQLLMNNCFKDELHLKLLVMLRLLSRDKNLVCNIDKLERHIKNISQYIDESENGSSDDKFFSIQAIKFMSNWIYHSQDVRTCLMKIGFVKNMIILLVKNGFELDDSLFFKMRVMFLMSALESEEQERAVESGGIDISVKAINKILDQLSSRPSLDEMNNKILPEVLKALFNITRNSSTSSSKSVIKSCSLLVVALQSLIRTKVVEESESLMTHISHALVNLPKDSLEHLCPKVRGKKEHQVELLGHPMYYEERDMSAIIILLHRMQENMKIKEYVKMQENTLAVFTAFCYVCRKIPLIRKYLRQEVLPPLVVSDVHPEERKDMCGDVVRLMTTVDVTLKNMAADFLFVLCKENVTRLIRYSGYGNCAGYLASRGLMIPTLREADGEYSEDELSDVDENLDVMTGATAQPKEDVLANLTEEEKEEEVKKLMNLFGKLKGLDVLKPVLIGQDGKIVEMDDMDNQEDDDSDY